MDVFLLSFTGGTRNAGDCAATSCYLWPSGADSPQYARTIETHFGLIHGAT